MPTRIKILFWSSFLYVIIALTFWGKSLRDSSVEIYNLEKQKLQERQNQISPTAYTKELKSLNDQLTRKKYQYFGEGFTFLFFILLSGGIVYLALKREHTRNNIQKNFILSMTHELKTPISSVKLALQTLQRPNLDHEVKNEILESGLSEINRLHTLTTNLLYVNRIDSKQLQIQKIEFNVFPVLDRVAQYYRNIQHTHAIDVSGPPFIMLGDEFLFEIIISNLVDNAIKYSANANNIEIKTLQSDDRKVIEIIDFGGGIPESQLKNVFNKFYRIGNENTRQARGTGMGLYIVKKTSALLGMEVSYKYDNGRSIFTLTF